MIEWCTHHKNDPPSTGDDDDSRRKTTDIDEWDQKFMQVDQEMLFEIILVCDVPLTLSRGQTNFVRPRRLPTTSISRAFWTSAARPWRT